jgi:hypothetical protein
MFHFVQQTLQEQLNVHIVHNQTARKRETILDHSPERINEKTKLFRVNTPTEASPPSVTHKNEK